MNVCTYGYTLKNFNEYFSSIVLNEKSNIAR